MNVYENIYVKSKFNTLGKFFKSTYEGIEHEHRFNVDVFLV